MSPLRVRTPCFLALGLLLAACNEDPPPLDPQPIIPPDPVSEWETTLDPDLNAVAIVDPSTRIAVGSDGAVLMLENGAATAMESGSDSDLHSIHVFGEGDIYAGGSGGVLLHYDGQAWREVEVFPGNVTVYDVWGSSPSDMWAVGFQPNVVNPASLLQHFDGVDWTPVAGAPSGAWLAVWGSGPEDVYVVGFNGAARFDGDSWSTVDVPGPIFDVYGTAQDDVYLAGPQGVYHYDGVTSSGPYGPAQVTSIEGDETGVYVLGGAPHQEVHRFIGVESELVLAIDSLLEQDSPLRAIAAGAGQRTLVGSARTVVVDAGSGWTVRMHGTTRELFAVGGTSDTDVYATGPEIILHFDGVDWTVIREAPSVEFILGVAASDEGVWFARSGDYSVLHLRDGVWDSVDVGAAYLSDIWAAPTGEVFAVGAAAGGYVAFFDGSEWTSMEVPPSTGSLTAVWGSAADDVFATGANEIVHYDGESWQHMQFPPTPATIGDIYGFASDSVFAVAIDGSVLRYDGESWTRIHTFLNGASSITGSAADDLYVVAGGEIHHFDGVDWTPVLTPPTPPLAFWSSPTDRIYAVGTGGIRMIGTR